MASLKTGDGERLTREKFRELLGRPWYMALLVIVPCGAMVAFAAAQTVGWAIGAPIALVLAILLAGRGWAAGKARRQVMETFAAARGLTVVDDPDPPSWTPLLRAGDERRMSLALTGVADGMPVHVAHYTFTEISTSTDSDGHTRTERDDHDFTVASTEVAATSAIPLLYLKPDTGLFDFGDGWLSTGDLVRCETESVRFNERYKGWHRREQDPMILRRFLDPSTVDTLANHPLHFGLELQAGRLLVYIKGHCADSGELAALLEALATLRRCLLAAARAGEPATASHPKAAVSVPPPA